MPKDSVRAILLDIEGTTTPISFVHDILFPYSRLHLESFLNQHTNSPDVIADLDRLRDEHAQDIRLGHQPPPLNEPYLSWLIEHDRKSPALKSIQGKIWRQGYDDGSLTSTVFPDVRPAMERWTTIGKSVSIFSSGSVLAQKLLFANTNDGDLTKFISNYFDTAVGKKNDPESYLRIAAALSIPPQEVHFISDVLTELDAAADAGMSTSLSIRPGYQKLDPNTRHPIIRTFDDLS